MNHERLYYLIYLHDLVWFLSCSHMLLQPFLVNILGYTGIPFIFGERGIAFLGVFFFGGWIVNFLGYTVCHNLLAKHLSSLPLLLSFPRFGELVSIAANECP